MPSVVPAWETNRSNSPIYPARNEKHPNPKDWAAFTLIGEAE
ncbi:hypothetical protein [Lusitaniella coriacea]